MCLTINTDYFGGDNIDIDEKNILLQMNKKLHQIYNPLCCL